MEMINNDSQCDVEITDPKILKTQRQIFALGLSGLIIVALGLAIFWLFWTFMATVIECFILPGVKINEGVESLIFFISFLIPGTIGITLGRVAIIKAKKLKKIGQLKNKAVTGNVFAKISFWRGIVDIASFFLLILAIILSMASGKW